MAEHVLVKPEIKLGDFWTTKDGDIFFVTGRNEDNTHWLVNRVSADARRGLVCEGLAEDNQRFERRLDPKEARRRITSIIEEGLFILK